MRLFNTRQSNLTTRPRLIHPPPAGECPPAVGITIAGRKGAAATSKRPRPGNYRLLPQRAAGAKISVAPQRATLPCQPAGPPPSAAPELPDTRIDDARRRPAHQRTAGAPCPLATSSPFTRRPAHQRAAGAPCPRATSSPFTRRPAHQRTAGAPCPRATSSPFTRRPAHQRTAGAPCPRVTSSPFTRRPAHQRAAGAPSGAAP